VKYNCLEIILKLFQCFISHVTTSKTDGTVHITHFQGYSLVDACNVVLGRAMHPTECRWFMYCNCWWQRSNINASKCSGIGRLHL